LTILAASILAVFPCALATPVLAAGISAPERGAAGADRAALPGSSQDREARAVVAPEEVYDNFAEDVIRALQRAGTRVLTIDENLGGDVDAATDLARWIHWQGVAVKVLRGCISACARIALASRDLRMAPGAVIGLHSWRVERGLRDEIIDVGPEQTEAIWRAEREFLDEILQPAAAAKIYRLTRETPYDDVILLDVEVLREIGIRVTVE
jgi:membrane-bound ClpP family serine protease